MESSLAREQQSRSAAGPSGHKIAAGYQTGVAERQERPGAEAQPRPSFGYLVALWFGKLVYGATRLTGRRGSALPGLIVERVFPRFLPAALAQLPGGVVVVTGTNGKTTSTKMLARILETKYAVLTNPTGSNFTRGVVASILPKAKKNGRLPYDVAVLELDEAYAARFARSIPPRAILVTNVMRDQLDRFGEIDHTARLLTEAVARTSEVAVLNRDDPRVARMASATEAQIVFFGVSPTLRPLFLSDDELHQPGLLSTNDGDVLTELRSIASDDRVVITLAGTPALIRLRASSTHNAQNAAGVAAMALALGMDKDAIVQALSGVEPAFGRGEQIEIDGRKVTLQLVKNPGGFRHALLSNKHRFYDRLLIAINDDFADGRDVSWLWDVGFRGVVNGGSICTTGNRAHDMGLRLKYDEIAVCEVEPSLEKALGSTLHDTPPKARVLIYTTYTAMLALRRLLSKRAKVEKV